MLMKKYWINSLRKNLRRSGHCACLLTWLVLANCGSSGGAMTRVVDNQYAVSPPPRGDAGAPALPEIQEGKGGAGVASVQYRAAQAGENTAVGVELKATDETLELWAVVDGTISDLYLALDHPAVLDGDCQVEWGRRLKQDFVTLAVLDQQHLSLGVAGIRKADSSEVASCLTHEARAKLLLDRHSLSGEVHICTLYPAGAPDARGINRDCSSVVDAQRGVSALGDVSVAEAG